MRDQLRDFIVDKILEGSAPDDLDDETDLIERGLIDSRSMLELIAFIESQGLVLDIDDMLSENFESVSAVAELVRRKRSGAGGDT